MHVRFQIPENDTSYHITEHDRKRTASETPRTLSARLNTSTVDYKHLDNLYLNGVNKKKRFEMMDKVKRQEAEKKEIEACTFQPKLNKSYKPVSSNVINSNLPIYERQAIWHNKKVEKIEKQIKTNRYKEPKYSFTPIVKKSKLMFSEQEYDKQTQVYIDRVKAAQKQKQEVKEKLSTKCRILFILDDNIDKKINQRNNIKEATVSSYTEAKVENINFRIFVHLIKPQRGIEILIWR
jgi:hypothetical protein